MMGVAEINARLSGKVRVILVANVFVLAAFFASYAFDPIYDSLKRAGLADALSWCIYILLFASTLFASWLCLGNIHAHLRGSTTRQRHRGAIALDGALLLAWWVTLLTIVAWAQMLGTGLF